MYSSNCRWIVLINYEIGLYYIIYLISIQGNPRVSTLIILKKFNIFENIIFKKYDIIAKQKFGCNLFKLKKRTMPPCIQIISLLLLSLVPYNTKYYNILNYTYSTAIVIVNWETNRFKFQLRYITIFKNHLPINLQ